MAKVFVVQRTTHGIGKAAEFGDLIYMSDHERDDFNNLPHSQRNQRLLTHLAEMLKEYDPESDFILPVGSPYVQHSVFWILGAMGVRQVRILRWDNRDKLYIPLTLNLRPEMYR